MKKTQPTLHDIARISGLSISTVNRVLQDKKYVASDKARDRVVEALEMLGYEPSRYIQSLRGEQVKTIAFIMPRHDAYYASIIDTIEHQKGAETIRIIAMASNEKASRQDELIDWFVSQQVDGLIISPISSQMTIAKRWRDIPMVIIDNQIEDDLPYVGINHEDNAYKATTHLLNQAHKSIALLLGNADSSATADARMGYQAALEDYEQKMDTRLVTYQYQDLSLKASEAYGYETTKQLFYGETHPSALVIENHALLKGALLALNENGFNIPKDVAVVSLEESSWNKVYQPTITSVGSSAEDIGKTLFNQLKRFFSGDTPKISSEWLPTQLIERRSSKY